MNRQKSKMWVALYNGSRQSRLPDSKFPCAHSGQALHATVNSTAEYHFPRKKQQKGQQKLESLSTDKHSEKASHQV